MLESINQLSSLTVFAPIDDSFGRGQRTLMQQEGSDRLRTDDWGAYMVPAYYDFEDLVKI